MKIKLVIVMTLIVVIIAVAAVGILTSDTESSEKVNNPSNPNKPLTPKYSSDWNNYIYENDIKNLEYSHTDFSGQCDVFEGITTGECVNHKGKYLLNADPEKNYNVIIQVYGKLTVEEYTDYLNDLFSGEVQQGDYFHDDFYFLGENKISWYSENMFVLIELPESFEDSGDLIEDIVGTYANEYPSGLKFNPTPDPVE